MSRAVFRNAEDGVPYKRIVPLPGVFRRANAVRPYRVDDGFCDFHGQPQGLSLRVVFHYVGDDAHIVPNHMLIHSPAANRFVRDTEPYEFCRK